MYNIDVSDIIYKFVRVIGNSKYYLNKIYKLINNFSLQN